MNEWISIKDRLPRKRGKYLCVVDGFLHNPNIRVLSYTNNLYSVDKYDFYNRKGKSGFYDYDSEYVYCEIDVYYWMKLPDLPKEE